MIRSGFQLTTLTSYNVETFISIESFHLLGLKFTSRATTRKKEANWLGETEGDDSNQRQVRKTNIWRHPNRAQTAQSMMTSPFLNSNIYFTHQSAGKYRVQCVLAREREHWNVTTMTHVRKHAAKKRFGATFDLQDQQVKCFLKR